MKYGFICLKCGKSAEKMVKQEHVCIKVRSLHTPEPNTIKETFSTIPDRTLWWPFLSCFTIMTVFFNFSDITRVILDKQSFAVVLGLICTYNANVCSSVREGRSLPPLAVWQSVPWRLYFCTMVLQIMRLEIVQSK